MSAVDVVLREARKEDVPQIMGLIKELADYENMLDRVKIDEQTLIRDGFESNPPAYKAYVVEDRAHPGVLIGYALGSMTYASWLGKRFYIEDIMITEKYKKKGVGSKLLGFVCKETLKRGCVVINFVVGHWNSSVDFYHKMGAVNSTAKNGWHWYELPKPVMEKLSARCDK